MSNGTLRDVLAHYDEDSFTERLDRLSFLEELIGDADWRFTPAVVVHLFEEAKLLIAVDLLQQVS